MRKYSYSIYKRLFCEKYGLRFLNHDFRRRIENCGFFFKLRKVIESSLTGFEWSVGVGNPYKARSGVAVVINQSEPLNFLCFELWSSYLERGAEVGKEATIAGIAIQVLP